LTNMFVMLGGFIFQPTIGKILDYMWTGQYLEGGIRFYTTTHWQVALSVLPMGLVLTVLLSLFLKETHCKVRED
ncbi:MAG: MFS transporter, partial [Coxiellaceae bacterium]|nr:MFS transporter [Coxiellaceae bacterium]